MSIAVNHHYSTIMKLFYFIFILPCITGAPVPVDSFYDKFIENLLNNNCKMPKEIKLPLNLFNSSSDPVQFGYLSTPLNECQKAEALQEDTEPHLLCKEVFEVLRNITCLEYKSSLPEIKITLSFNNVCSEFNAMKDIFPQGEYIAPRLVDGFTCKLLCSDKFESLCQTLVWSYYVQAQMINGVFETTEHKDKNEIANKGLSAGKGNVNTQKKDSTNEEPDNVNDLTQTEVELNKTPSVGESNMENAVTVSLNFSTHVSSSQIPSSNSDTQNQNPNNQKQNLKNTTEKIKTPVETKFTVTEKQSIDKINEVNGAQENKNIDLGSKSKSENVNLKKEDKDIVQPVDPKLTQHTTDASNDQISIKDASGSISPDIKSNKASESVTNNMQGTIKSVNPMSSNNTPDNKINNFDNHEQENEAKGKEPETTLKNPDEGDASNIGKISDNTKEASPGILSMIPSETDSKLEFTSQIPLEETFDAGIPPDGEDPETYPDDSNELLTDDEFSETEHGKTPSKSSQEKVPKDESSVHGEIEAGISSDSINNDPFMNSRKSVDIPIMGSFPEQEDSHFFFYFLSIVLILMAGYLIFHNKQKIIALIVEGRHERSRRRSHGAGYKKLETK